jgi:hypothetical protein
MFFQKFAVEVSELQRWLATANDTLNASSAETLTSFDKQILLHDDFPAMLTTNEPPATRFAIARIAPITMAAIHLENLADEEAKRFVHSCFHLLTLGSPTVCRAVLLHCIPMLCTALKAARPDAKWQEAGSAGVSIVNALDDHAYAARCEALQQESSSTAADLPMNAAQILLTALRTSGNGVDTTMISDSLRGVQLSSSGNKSGRSESAADTIHDHRELIAVSVAHALGIAKQSVRLLVEVINHAPTAASACGATLMTLMSETAHKSFVESVVTNAKAAALLEALEAVAATSAPGTTEGEVFGGLFDMALGSSAFLDRVTIGFFTDFDNVSSVMRQSSLRAFEAILITNQKWESRWRTDAAMKIAMRIRKLSANPNYLAVVAAGRREDQLRCVAALHLGIKLVIKACRGPSVADVDPAPPTEFAGVRELLPAAEAFQALLPACDKSPMCTILHSAALNVLDAVAALSAAGGLTAPTPSGSKYAKLTSPALAATSACVLLDEMCAHGFVAQHQEHPELRALAVSIAAAVHGVVAGFAEVNDPYVAVFNAFCRQTAEAGIRCALNPDVERNIPERERLRRYCTAATQRPPDLDLTGGSVIMRLTARVVVDEVDALDEIPKAPPPLASIAEPLRTSARDESPQGSPGLMSPDLAGQSISIDRPDSDELSAQSSLTSQGSRKFAIKRRTASNCASPNVLMSPVSGAALASSNPEMDPPEAGNQLSLTSSLNESVHSSFDHRSFDVEDGPLAVRRAVRRRSPQPTSAHAAAPAGQDLFKSFGTSERTDTTAPTPNLFAAWMQP